MSQNSNLPLVKKVSIPTETVKILDAFIEYLLINLGRSKTTAKAYRTHTVDFIHFLAMRNTTLTGASTADIDEWIRYLFHHRRNHAGQTRASKLAAIRALYLRLVNTGAIASNPAASVVSPYVEKHLPRKFTDRELKALLSAPDTSRPEGLRDYALLITLYTTGARNQELCNLDKKDVTFYDRNREARIFIFGKGRKERILSIRSPASRIIGAYILHLAPGPLFVSLSRRDRGRRLTSSGVNYILKKYARLVNIKEADVFAHKMRTTFATNLHEDKKDVVEISRQLGHEDIKTTMKYIAISDRTSRETSISGHRLQALGVRLPGEKEKDD